MPRLKFFEVERIGDVCVVTFTVSSIPHQPSVVSLGQELFDLVAEGARNLVLDFTQLDMISSAIVGKLISLNKKVNEKEGKLVICGLNPFLREYFEILKIDTLFIFTENSWEALRAF